MQIIYLVSMLVRIALKLAFLLVFTQNSYNKDCQNEYNMINYMIGRMGKPYLELKLFDFVVPQLCNIRSITYFMLNYPKLSSVL